MLHSHLPYSPFLWWGGRQVSEKHPFLPFILIQVLSLRQSLPLCYNHRSCMFAGLKIHFGGWKMKINLTQQWLLFQFQRSKESHRPAQCSLSAKFEHPFTGEFWNSTIAYQSKLSQIFHQTLTISRQIVKILLSSCCRAITSHLSATNTFRNS